MNLEVNNVYARYHKYMALRTSNDIPADILENFRPYNEAVAACMLKDELLKPEELKQANNIAAKYFMDLAINRRDALDLTSMFEYLDKVPVDADAYPHSLAMQTTAAISQLCGDKCNAIHVLPLLQKVEILARKMLEADFNQLSSKTNIAESDMSVANQLMLVLNGENPPEVESSGASHDLTDAARHLLLYRGYQYRIGEYREPLQRYLADVYSRLDAVAKQPAAPGSLWQQGLSLHLRFAYMALRNNNPLPTTMRGMIDLAATVHDHLQKDASDFGNELVNALPKFHELPQEQQRGVKRKRD